MGVQKSSKSIKNGDGEKRKNAGKFVKKEANRILKIFLFDSFKNMIY
jgi:hypothetical protein